MSLFPVHFPKCCIKTVLLLMQTKGLLLLLVYIKTTDTQDGFYCEAVTGNPMCLSLRFTVVLNQICVCKTWSQSACVESK